MLQIRHAWHIQVRRILVHQHKWESSGRGHPLSGVAWPKLVLLSKEPNGDWFQQVQISNPDISIYFASDQQPPTCSFFLVKVVLGSDLWRWLNEDLESWVSESKSPAVKQIETTVGCKVQKLGTAKGARSHQNSFVLWFLLFVEQSGRDWTFTSWEGIESNQ